jgi:hypothetical protein
MRSIRVIRRPVASRAKLRQAIPQRGEKLMTEQRNVMRITALERAIQTVVNDTQIPEELRTAMAAYRDLRRAEPTEPVCLPKTIRSSLSGVSERLNSRHATYQDRCILSCERTAIEQEIRINLWYNDEVPDWSIEINGCRHEHVTSETVEALVECVLIVAQSSLADLSAQRPQ